MACLSTSGRKGLNVVVGTRNHQTQKHLCKLFWQQKISRSFCSNAAIAAALLCKNNANSMSSLLPQRNFHGVGILLQRNAAITTGQDYFANMHTNTACNSSSSGPTSTTTTSSPNVNNKSSNSTIITRNCRQYSSVHTQQPAGPVREIQIDPYIILEDDLKYFYDDVRDLLRQGTSQTELDKIASYYFDGQGKALRPMVTMLMARAINYHLNKESSNLVNKQRFISLFSEMVHSASLVHDDVIDQSDIRRGKPSVNALWNHKKVTMAGDYVLSIASIMIARLKSDDVTIILSQILTDLVQGEFMQLGSKETENERFAHYLTKTYRKTASLIANALKATAVIADADENIAELAFQYGRNVGLAFQLVDDMLDFVSTAETMGKPTAADLKLGLATAPVLFACEKYPELNPMIMRRFSEPGDVERAFELVHKSHGLEQTRFLAKKHCIEAIRLAQELTESPYQKGLQVVADLVINRMK
ncbi:all trans-polyprenyl-diphosphate synthase PDSS1 [Bactrocera dorsalis]|uniref:All trans-polyprenyl-diphosphate synthase PDSS1 n=1 Tax=Bactrocera dorsalis TaxID=27457 RepID=A0A6I9V4S3_BACDO|nr:all trans-polyprenyl-diphosphate synthase PDSS1 [Bactrocera dorsalis]